MAQTQVEIEVELSGTGKVEKGIKEIEGGLEGIGETGSRLVEAMGTTNEKLGEGLENVSGTVGEVREAFGALGESITVIGQTGARGFMSLIGPLGMIVGAGIAVYETFRQITGAAQEAEEAEQAMNAASADLQSKLEALAEKGVIPTTKELERFSLAVIESQLAKESFENAMNKYRKQFDKITQAKKAAADASRSEAEAEKIGGAVYVQTVLKRQKALRDLNSARQGAKKIIHEVREEQKKALDELLAAGEQEQELEKRSTDNLKVEAKKLANLQKEAALIREKIANKGDEIAQAESEFQQKTKLLKLEEELEDANHEQTVAILARIRASGELNAIQIETMKLRQRQIEIVKKEEAEAKKAQAERRRRYKERLRQREQLLKKDLVLTSQIRQVEIKSLFEGNEQALELEKERHRATLELTKEGSKERELEEKRFQLAISKIKDRETQEEEQRRLERLQRLQEENEKEINLRYDLARRLFEIEQETPGFGTDMEALTFESEQRLKILELEFQREINLARMKGEEITDIQKRFAVERLAITQESTKEQAALLSEYFAEYSEGFAQAGFSALLFGESFQESTAQILKALAQQAVSQAVMQTAKGFGLLATKDFTGSAAAFKSAALYATAASVAGLASTALGGGGGGASQAGASPTGQPSVAPTPEREEVTTDSMVFNINFGGAVVYDTKKAAEQAFADRLVSIMNTPRRGAVQFNRR
jgi:hypothetical protein